MEGGRSAWLKHVMSVKKSHPSMSLGDAMKAAKKTYKKSKTGGTLMDKMGPMGGRRRKTAKVGGTAYGFTGGPYTGSDLPDGNSRFPALADATWQGPSELKGGRRRRSTKKAGRRHRKVGGAGGAELAPVSPGGKAADLPYAQPSVAPAAHESSGAVGPASEGSNAGPASFGGRRRRSSKKASRRH